MARKLKVEAEKSYLMLKDRQKATQEELAQTKVKLEKAARDVSSLDQRLGRTSEENAVLRKKEAMQVRSALAYFICKLGWNFCCLITQAILILLLIYISGESIGTWRVNVSRTRRRYSST